MRRPLDGETSVAMPRKWPHWHRSGRSNRTRATSMAPNISPQLLRCTTSRKRRAAATAPGPAARCNGRALLLFRPFLGEKLFPIGEAVGFQEEAEHDGAVGRHRLVLVAGRAPYELARSAHALVVLERALEHVGLLQRGVLVQRHDGAGREAEQRRGDAAVVGIQDLDLDAGKFRLL